MIYLISDKRLTKHWFPKFWTLNQVRKRLNLTKNPTTTNMGWSESTTRDPSCAFNPQ